MPELPEVEVVRRSLDNIISGLKINKVTILNSNLRYKISRNLKKATERQKVLSVSRRAKFILITLKNKNTVLIHLGMTGKIFVYKKKNKSTLIASFYYNNKFKKKHNHLIFHLSNSLDLIYNDVRKFGFIKILKPNNLVSNSHISKLGPEPLSKKFNYKYLRFKTRKSQKNVKNFMMDQKSIAGLGNIYVNEILFLSSINPRKKVKKLSNEEVVKIIFNTKRILLSSIQLGGSSISDFNNTFGKSGLFQ